MVQRSSNKPGKHAGIDSDRLPLHINKKLIQSGIVAMLGGLAVGSSATAWSADEVSIETLQRENERLRQQIEQLRQATGSSTSDAPPTTDATADTAATESTQSTASIEPERDEPPAKPGDIENVIVTAKKSLQKVIDVPQSISLVTGDDLRREDAVTLEAITRRLGNVKWNYGNSSTSNYSIRGLGKIANVDNGDPSVGLYVDGIAYAFNQMAYFNFVDVDTVEVARGPQGTSFGRNSSIGAIRVNYKRPSFTPGNEVIVGISKYEGQDWARGNGSIKATGISTGALVDQLLAYRTTLNVDKGGGWILNSYNPDNRYISSDRVSGRIQLLLQPSSTFNSRLSLDINPRNSENVNIGSTNFFFSQTPATFADGSPNTNLTTEQRLSRPWFTRNTDYTVVGDYFSQEFIASDTQQGVVTGSNGANLEFNWLLADRYQVSAISHARDYYFNAFRDDEGTVFDVQTAAGQNKYYKQYGQELRLVSQIDGVVDYQTGLFFQKSISDSAGNAIFGTDGGAWFATNAQYGRLDTTGPNGVSGRALLNDSLADLWRKAPTRSDNTSTALYANADWHITEPLTINTGIRAGQEKRELTASAFIKEQGFGTLLNPVSLGGFGNNAQGELAVTNSEAQLAIANQVAQRYFGLNTYAELSAAQKRQVADAKTIRNGRIGANFGPFTADAYKGDIYTYNVAPRYQITENVNAYLSLSYGEKSGLPGVLSTTGVPTSYEIRPEKNRAYEIGSKSTLLGGNLLFNVAVYLNDIKDYQQNVLLVDELATEANGQLTYVSAAGNVPKVRAQGVEIDGVYTGFRNLEIRYAAAYNDAYYKSFPTIANPVERANEGPFRDASGDTLPGVSKWSGNIGLTHTLPLANEKQLRSSVTTSYATKFNSDNALSSFGVIPAQTLTDASLTFGDSAGRAEVSFFVKNVFDDDTVRNRTWNAFAPGFPRQFGLTFSSRL